MWQFQSTGPSCRSTCRFCRQLLTHMLSFSRLAKILPFLRTTNSLLSTSFLRTTNSLLSTSFLRTTNKKTCRGALPPVDFLGLCLVRAIVFELVLEFYVFHAIPLLAFLFFLVSIYRSEKKRTFRSFFFLRRFNSIKWRIEPITCVFLLVLRSRSFSLSSFCFSRSTCRFETRNKILRLQRPNILARFRFVCHVLR